MFSWIKIVAVLAVLTLVVGFCWKLRADGFKAGRAEAIAEMQIKIDIQKRDAAALLESETAKARALEKALRKFKDEQEVKDAHASKTVADLQRQLHAAGGPTIRLRDPNADSGCRPGRSAPETGVAAAPSAGSDDAAKAGGLLSVQLTDLLNRLVFEADELNVAYASCRSYVLKLTAP